QFINFWWFCAEISWYSHVQGLDAQLISFKHTTTAGDGVVTSSYLYLIWVGLRGELKLHTDMGLEIPHVKAFKVKNHLIYHKNVSCNFSKKNM
ncbi:hypothetical protein ACJX0J_018301, partial [Zea mays]